MLNLPQLECALSACYPTSVSKTTQHKRKANIDALWTLIEQLENDYSLQHAELECRLEVFSSSTEEVISIQFPGKESAEASNNSWPYDFRPKIKTNEGIVLRDFVFKDMWGLVEHLNETHPDMIKVLATLFFQMGRMMLHQQITETYHCVLLDSNDNEIEHFDYEFSWYKLKIDEEILNSLNFFIPYVHIDSDTSISFESFLYFFDMILQNEDSKYYYKKRNLSSGRIPTSDSMLLLASHFLGHTPLSTLLQRYVSGFGVGKCLIAEIEPATGSLIKLVDRKTELATKLALARIEYRINSYITISGTNILVALKSNNPKVAFLAIADEEKSRMLESKGWMVFDFESAIDDEYFQQIIDLYDL